MLLLALSESLNSFQFTTSLFLIPVWNTPVCNLPYSMLYSMTTSPYTALRCLVSTRRLSRSAGTYALSRTNFLVFRHLLTCVLCAQIICNESNKTCPYFFRWCNDCTKKLLMSSQRISQSRMMRNPRLAWREAAVVVPPNHDSATCSVFLSYSIRPAVQ